MQGINRVINTVARAAAVAGTIVTFVEFINLFKHEAGIKKELFCENEKRLTTHISVSWDDVRSLRRNAMEKDLPFLQVLLQESDIVIMSLNPLAPKPYVCLGCNGVKWSD